MVATLALMGLSAVAGLAEAVSGGGSPPPASAAAAPAAGGTPNERLKKAANEFETVFLETVLDKMTETGGADGPLGENGSGGSVYRSMLAKEHAAAIVKSGGVGLSDAIYRQMLSLQEGAAR